MLLTLIRLQDYLTQNKLKTKLVNTVHDSIMATVPLDELEEVANNFKKIAEDYDFDWMSGVPLLFEIEVGNNWDELIPLDEWSEKVASSS
jgi:DNA polymerase I-like protein with 3'-5' exonuclease and polymerase domains